jgi:hypothetical protein
MSHNESCRDDARSQLVSMMRAAKFTEIHKHRHHYLRRVPSAGGEGGGGEGEGGELGG